MSEELKSELLTAALRAHRDAVYYAKEEAAAQGKQSAIVPMLSDADFYQYVKLTTKDSYTWKDRFSSVSSDLT
jgi:hypothetical protein